MDLDIVRVIRSIPPKHEPLELARLMTPFGERVDPAAPHPEHPRPSFARMRWGSLNGSWSCAFVSNPHARDAWREAAAPAEGWQPIVVPFSPETALSGVGRQLRPDELLWYRRDVDVPALGPDERLILHFDGVDFACRVMVDGTCVAEHEGAYLPFEVDVTDVLAGGAGSFELALCVEDPSETGCQLRGKQRLDRGDMWYTAQSGIWQDVWWEVVPASRLRKVQLLADPDMKRLSVRATTDVPEGADAPELHVTLWDGDVQVASAAAAPSPGAREVTLAMGVPAPRLWSPDDPHLYRVTLAFGADEVESWCAFRTVGIEEDAAGVRRFCLNHRPLFLRGLLDQGYWPESLLTPPSEEAMAFDIRTACEAGFNLLRKHIKVEGDRWYHLCDRMGMLVWQDMPSGGDELDARLTRDIPTLWRRSWATRRDDTPHARAALAAGDAGYRAEWTATCEDVVGRLGAHPCVVGWTLFNESWGQFDAATATELVGTLDPTRPILSASGWYDQGSGDVQGIHNYFRGMHVFDDPWDRRQGGTGQAGHMRAQLLSEFGGLTLRVDGHSCLDRTYGYAAFEDAASWRKGLQALLAQVDALEADGLAGFVYTQLTDVEEETNGILTYDRRVNKLADGGCPPECPLQRP